MIFQDLQDFQSFAPIVIEIFGKNLQTVLKIFEARFFQISAKITIFQYFSSNFVPIPMKFSRDFAEWLLSYKIPPKPNLSNYLLENVEHFPNFTISDQF